MEGSWQQIQEGRYLYKSILTLRSLPDEDFAEVPHLFASNFYSELGSEWSFVDPRQQVHMVKYLSFGSIHFITEGLESIRKFYGLHGVHWFILKYVGQSVFDIVIYNDHVQEISHQKVLQNPVVLHPLALPRTPITYHCYFTKIMSKSKIKSCQLSIPKPIGVYMCGRGLNNWKLRGPSGTMLSCKINAPTHMNYVKLGSGWRQFCNVNGVRDGAVLTFVAAADPNKLVDVVINYQQS